MAHCRTINPKFFRNEVLCELSAEARLLFVGLWTLADRAGRLEDRPKRIQAELFPYGISTEVDILLELLDSKGFIFRYSFASDNFIQIPKWFSYQHPHPRESESTFPQIPWDLNDFKGAREKARQSREKDMGCNVKDMASPSVSSVSSGTSKPSVPSGISLPMNGSGWRESTFREFWKIVWAKVGKGDARKAWIRKVSTKDFAATLIERAKVHGPRLLEEARSQGRTVLHPATWINGERYDDEPLLIEDPDPYGDNS